MLFNWKQRKKYHLWQFVCTNANALKYNGFNFQVMCRTQTVLFNSTWQLQAGHRVT